jgi:ParB-like chromosome segregation protein Spo0J
MPIEYVTDPRTGRIVAKGSLGFGQAVVPEAPPRPRAKPKPAAKPKPPGVFGFGPGGFSLGRLGNDLRYELNQLRSDPVRSIERGTNFAMRNTVSGIAFQQGAMGATTAATNAARSAIEYKQRASGRTKADYTTSPTGRLVDQVENRVYQGLGQTAPSEMSPSEKAVRDIRSSLTLAAAGGAAFNLGLRALSGVRFVGPAAQALENAIDPSKAQTLLGFGARVAADATVGEAITTPLDDNTGGSAAGLVDMVLGTKLDPVKPGMDRTEAAAAAFVPNVAAGALLSGAFAGIARARAARRAVQPIQEARAELQGAGVTQVQPETGAAAFAPEAVQGAAPTLREANAELERRYGIAPAPEAKPEPAAAPAAIPSQPMEPGGSVSAAELPSADPAAGPWGVDYDPSLPEADVAFTLIKNSSDAELLDSLRGGGAVLSEIDQRIAARPPVEADPVLSTELTGAPSEKLADPITPFADQWKRLGQKDPNALLAVLHPDVNPALAERAQAMFGRSWEDLTPQDAVDTLQAAAADGTTVMPNRLLPGQQMMRTSDILRDPERFQYKAGTDARGVQRGSSLEGVDRWNSDMEGAIEVWQDPKDGNYYVVNGHNRLAKAQELGINTLPVREIIADTAEQAKTAGALSNIASGGGTPIDAAWFMKGAGIADPQQLESMGVPLSPTSGHGLSGFQLSRLPEDILRAAETGQIKQRQAQIIGGSGADESSMRAAYRYLVENTGTTEGRLRNMLEMSRQMTGDIQASSRAEQTDLLKGTSWDQTFNKQMIAVADLADEVATLLKREKRLFTMADANSATLEANGSRIDKASAQQVADANARAIEFFQRTWMETGPIRDLLNEGGSRVAAGENKGAIAKQIKNRLVGQLGDLMGEQAVIRADVVQEDLLSQAPQQLDELLPEDRPSLEMMAIQKAIQNGEVRPPETPIPDLPGDSGVDLTKVQRDLAGNTVTDDVVRALDDELALRDAFGEMDQAMAQEAERAAREATGYDLLTFEEKKQAGMVDEIREPAPGTLAAKKRAEQIASLESSIRQTEQSRIPAALANGRTEFANDLRSHAAKLRKQLEALTGQAPPERMPFTFPSDLSKSAPRYGMAKVEFSSDLDRAAYMLRDGSKKSKGEDRLVKALEDAGYSLPGIRAHGEKVKQALKQAATEQTGSAAAPQSAMTLRVPEQRTDAGEMDSPAGWDSADTTPFKPDDQERIRREEELRQVIREVAGDEVSVRFKDKYETVTKSAEWGGDGKQTTARGGFYRLMEDLIQVNGVMHDETGHTGLAPLRVETAYHESFHRLQYISLTPEEAAVLNGNWARIKIGVGSGHIRRSAPIAYAESQAVAFQRYAAARRVGEDPVAAMLGSYRPETGAAQKAVNLVISGFDRIFDVFEKLYNRFTKGTFDSTRAIFERARRGDLAQADNWEGPGGEINPGSGMDMMDRPASEYGWRRSSAFKEPLAGGGLGDMASPGPSVGRLFDDLNSALGDPDPRTGMARGLSKAAVKQALSGDPSRALSEGMQLAETRLSDLSARIEAVKQRAATEGC